MFFIPEVLDQRCGSDLSGELFPKYTAPDYIPNLSSLKKKSPGNSGLHLWLKFAYLNYFLKLCGNIKQWR